MRIGNWGGSLDSSCRQRLALSSAGEASRHVRCSPLQWLHSLHPSTVTPSETGRTKTHTLSVTLL